MRRTLFALAALVAGTFALMAAEKDTALAANTRTKKLQGKISVEYNDEELKEILKDIKGKLEDAGLGSLSWSYDQGVSQNQKLSFTAKDKTVEEILDGLFKKPALGYVVVSKEKDRYDGWLKITKGNERGWVSGQEPKDAKAKPKDAKPKDTKPATVDAEKEANGKLELAKSLLKDGKPDKAKTRFQEVVDKYPTTKAAEEAKKELDKLGK